MINYEDELLNICITWLKNKPRLNKVNNRVTASAIASKIGRIVDKRIPKTAVIEALKKHGILYESIERSNDVYVAMPAEVLEFHKYLLNQQRIRKCQPLLPYQYNEIPGYPNMSEEHLYEEQQRIRKERIQNKLSAN